MDLSGGDQEQFIQYSRSMARKMYMYLWGTRRLGSAVAAFPQRAALVDDGPNFRLEKGVVQGTG